MTLKRAQDPLSTLLGVEHYVVYGPTFTVHFVFAEGIWEFPKIEGPMLGSIYEGSYEIWDPYYVALILGNSPLGVSKKQGPQYRPQYTRILIRRTPTQGP